MSSQSSRSPDAPSYPGGIDIASFESGDIKPGEFSHEAHLHVAWCYLQQSDLQNAIVQFTTALRRLTEKMGVPGKYHETISWFFIMIIAERQKQFPRADWMTFKRSNTDLFTNAKEVLSRYYSPDRLESKLARKQFILPDRPG